MVFLLPLGGCTSGERADAEQTEITGTRIIKKHDGGIAPELAQKIISGRFNREHSSSWILNTTYLSSYFVLFPVILTPLPGKKVKVNG